jgi:hypothetical protein
MRGRSIAANTLSSIPPATKLHDPVVVRARDPFGLLPQSRHPAPSQVAHPLVVARGGPHVQLHPQDRAVIEQGVVRPPHRDQRLLAGETGAGPFEERLELVETALERRDEDRPLGRKEAEKVRLRNPDAASNRLGGRALVSPSAELGPGCVEHQLSSTFRAHARARAHAAKVSGR